MKKPTRKKLALDRDVVRVLNAELADVVGGKPGCSRPSSCWVPPPPQ